MLECLQALTSHAGLQNQIQCVTNPSTVQNFGLFLVRAWFLTPSQLQAYSYLDGCRQHTTRITSSCLNGLYVSVDGSFIRTTLMETINGLASVPRNACQELSKRPRKYLRRRDRRLPMWPWLHLLRPLYHFRPRVTYVIQSQYPPCANRYIGRA